MVLASYFIGILVLVVGVITALMSVWYRYFDKLVIVLLLSIISLGISTQMAAVAQSLGVQIRLLEEEVDDYEKVKRRESFEQLNQQLKPKLYLMNAAQIGILIVHVLIILNMIKRRKGIT